MLAAGFYKEFPNEDTPAAMSPSRIIYTKDLENAEAIRIVDNARTKIPVMVRTMLDNISRCKNQQDFWAARQALELPKNAPELDPSASFVLHAMDMMINNSMSHSPLETEYEAGVRARGVSPFTEDVFRSQLGFRVVASEGKFLSTQKRTGNKHFHKADFFACDQNLPGIEIFITESKVAGTADPEIQCDLAKLFRMQKDSLDRIVTGFSIEGVRPIVFGLQSIGADLQLYAMIRPYNNAVECVRLLQFNTAWNVEKRCSGKYFAYLLETMLAICIHCREFTAVLKANSLGLQVSVGSVINITGPTPVKASGRGRARDARADDGHTESPITPNKLSIKLLMGFRELGQRVGYLSLSCTGLTSVKGQRLVIKLLRDHENWRQELHVHAYVTQRQVCVL